MASRNDKSDKNHSESRKRDVVAQGSEERRRRLKHLKEAVFDVQKATGEGGKKSRELNLWDLHAKREERRKQLQLLQEFLRNPSVIDLKDDVIPTSSSRAEIEQRKKELQYRIDILKALLEVTEGELELLSRAATVDIDNTTS
jgi:hypothetical protein